MRYIKKPISSVKCQYCKKSFIQKRSSQKYCDRKCSKYYRTRKSMAPYIIHKKDKCEFCNFIPIDLCQLDVDHIDGNHKNNNIENLQTLCANCHRLKTKLSKNYVK